MYIEFTLVVHAFPLSRSVCMHISCVGGLVVLWKLRKGMAFCQSHDCISTLEDKKGLSFLLQAMKTSKATKEWSPVLKSFYGKVQDVLCCNLLPDSSTKLDRKLEQKMRDIKKGSSGRSNFRSIDSIIMKFPHFREGLKEIRGVFKKYDEDSNGTIDHEELKKCLHTLNFCITEEEIDALFNYCDMDENEGIQFHEFIVLLCLIYLLSDSSTSSDENPNICSPEIQATFKTMTEVFLFLDKSGDGKLRRKDVVKAFNETSAKEKSPSHITRTRFKEMDWDKNGKVSFKEFLFAFISWVGIDLDDEDSAII